jgi:hypothetical protein
MCSFFHEAVANATNLKTSAEVKETINHTQKEVVTEHFLAGLTD